MKNTIKYIVEIIDIPAFVTNKKQKIIANNQYFINLLQNTDVSKNKELSERITDFIEKPDKFVDMISNKDKIRFLKTLTSNHKIINLLFLLDDIGYKVTHFTSLNISIDYGKPILSSVFIFRLFTSSLPKDNELFIVMFDLNIVEFFSSIVSKKELKEIEEINKKYTVLFQIANRVFSVVKGFTETLILGKYKDSDLIYKFIEVIDNQVSQGIKILLSFNLSDHIGDISFQNINLYKFLNDLVNKYSEKLISDYPELIFDYYIQPNIPDLYTDPSKLELCLYNLLDNAVRFRDEKKEKCFIKFTAFFESSVNHILMIVEDNGIGMDKDEILQLGQIFKTFSDKSGIGLGMYTVYKIIKAMKWNIKIESEKYKYTKVILTIPLENV
ncbi:MAG: ATP-binding protein [Candidatus Calescibacterium sp.]|nr:ATP-binding protein [Candidatus Calescibacterium sp.]MDW8132253.1 ATP-binding protein [Candidatus Calescibacterium sp.]